MDYFFTLGGTVQKGSHDCPTIRHILQYGRSRLVAGRGMAIVSIGPIFR
jgi:hypothetical protein